MKVEKIAVLTSGGDAPGMNAAIRAVIRMGVARDLEVFGVYGGYQGLIDDNLKPLGSRDVGNIIQRGGTILRTARSEAFTEQSGLEKAKENLESRQIQGLVVIGGNGTYRGAMDLLKIWDGGVIGVPGTIDNDIYGTHGTIGYDTAINTAREAIDKVRDTADAHERFFLIEVMGRHAGFIALDVAVAGGAEAVLLPECKTDLKAIARDLSEARKKGKTSSIVIVAEGEEEGGAQEISEKLKKLSQCDYRHVVLGHIQRGGSPTARDRILATKLGAYSVECLLDGQSGVAVGEVHDELTITSFEDAVSKKKPLDSYLQKLIPILSQ